MNPVYLRMLVYSSAAAIAALGFGTLNLEAGTLLIDLDGITKALAVAFGANGIVFGLWGKK